MLKKKSKEELVSCDLKSGCFNDINVAGNYLFYCNLKSGIINQVNIYIYIYIYIKGFDGVNCKCHIMVIYTEC